MRACARKVEWLSMEGKVPSGRGEFRPVEVPLVTAEAGSPFRKMGEEVTYWLPFKIQYALNNILSERISKKCQKGFLNLPILIF